MRWALRIRRGAVLVALAGIGVGSAAADNPPPPAFQTGFFLQEHQKDPRGAIAAYDKVVNDTRVAQPWRDEARQRLTQCRHDLIAEDFARALPASTSAYLEINQPGKQLGQLIKLFGLTQGSGTAPPPGQPGIPVVSPTLIEALGEAKGLAIAVTGFDPRRGPDGIMMLHLGDSKLLRGLLETGLSALPASGVMHGFKIHGAPHEIQLAISDRLLIVTRSGDEIRRTAARIAEASGDCLADQPIFQKNRAERRHAAFYLHVSGTGIRQQLAAVPKQREMDQALKLLDVEHLDGLNISAGPTATGLAFQVSVDFKEGQQNLAYGLVRTAPFSRRSLDHVPAHAAAVLMIGLNPAGARVAPTGAQPEVARALALMDFGRELFANIEEVSFFVTPRVQPPAAPGLPPIPEMGVAFGVKNAAQTQLLWNFLLGIPTMAGVPVEAPPRPVQIGGQTGTEYAFRGAPRITVISAKDGVVIAGTSGAVLAALEANQSNNAASDPAFAPLLDRLTATSSKALFIHAGRMAELAKQVSGPRQNKELELAARLLEQTRISFATDEGATHFAVRFEISGLPSVHAVAEAAGTQLPKMASQKLTVPGLSKRAIGPRSRPDASDPKAPKRPAGPSKPTPPAKPNRGSI